jgi:hypothetical protein
MSSSTDEAGSLFGVILALHFGLFIILAILGLSGACYCNKLEEKINRRKLSSLLSSKTIEEYEYFLEMLPKNPYSGVDPWLFSNGICFLPPG